VSFSIDLQFGDPRWRKVRGLSARLTSAATLALRQGGAGRTGALAILLTDDSEVRALNHQFRGKNKNTNVLSFPARAGGDYLGDVALAYGVTQKEAQSAGKRFSDHASHLVVHGVLHLLGFDHVKPRDAAVMEPMETDILRKLGIADPYAPEAA
jgi:probable rRNA maturation factor